MAASPRFFVALVLLSLLCGLTAAKDFLVGGDVNGWSVPSSSQALNKWAEANRFQVGYSLVWKYDSKKDSVLQVTREDYLNCNTSAPLAGYKDGNTSVELGKSGAYYFISGAAGACGKGQKLIVVVMSERRLPAAAAVAAASPAPSPAQSEGPAVAPASGDAATVGRGLLRCFGLLVALVLMGGLAI